MNLPAEFLGLAGKTLFMAAANPQAVLVTRHGKKMRRRALDFSDAHAALDWCLKARTTFVLLPRAMDNKLN